MAKKQKPTKKLPPSVRSIADKQKLIEQLLQEGIGAFNACIRAGLSPFDACKYEDMINKHISFERFSKMTNRDIAERRGITLGRMMDKLKEAAGIGCDNNGVPYEGAKKTISAMIVGKEAGSGDTDFVDVPDWYTRIRAIQELAKLGGFIERPEKSDDDEKEQGSTIVIVRPNNTQRCINVQAEQVQ